ncbi:hypothetical protein OF83DRAFT_342646 [Amylostereum chailletii]|nr:hypothetical protein OF83DRAFT_342646 [Amylostereum chailletii]
MMDPSKLVAPPLISILPPEILAEIFMTFSPSQYQAVSIKTKYMHIESEMSQEHANVTRTWWSIPQVCQRWRQVALQSSCFWSSILFSHPDLTSTMLSRSKSAPLSVSFLDPPPFDRAATASSFSLVLPHVTHIDNFMVMCSPHILRQIAGTATRAPTLTSCSLTCLHDDQLAHDPISIPSTFLHGHAPLLQVLHLSECWLPWTSPLFQDNITTLVLTSVQRMDTEEDFRQMIDALERMPRLRLLVLVRRPPHIANHMAGRHVKLPPQVEDSPLGRRARGSNEPSPVCGYPTFRLREGFRVSGFAIPHVGRSCILYPSLSPPGLF